MNLLKIKELAEKRVGGLRKLAKDIEMSEANLHRCISANKIQAIDLEKIANIFSVPVGYFFDEVGIDGKAEKTIEYYKQEIERLKNIIVQKDDTPVFLAIPLNIESEYIDLREMKSKVIRVLSK